MFLCIYIHFLIFNNIYSALNLYTFDNNNICNTILNTIKYVNNKIMQNRGFMIRPLNVCAIRFSEIDTVCFCLRTFKIFFFNRRVFL